LFRLAFWLAVCLVRPAHAGVVSLNVCTDDLLVALAPERVAALSPLARDPALSVVAAQAAHLPWVRADAEAVLALHPDLVLAGEYGAQAVLGVLRAHGLRVEQFGEPADFAGVAAQVTAAARVLGVPARGAAMVAAMQARLAAVRPVARGSAVLWQARGFSAGPGGFGDAVLRAAGYRDLGTGGEMGVEALLALRPDMLITEAAPAYPSLATNMLWHPALAGLARRTVQPALMTCPGPWSVAAVEALSR
jgi:iron complex transport system substrate-binding protein